MLSPPPFASLQAFIARRSDAAFWRPYVEAILACHGLTRAGEEIEDGYNVSYPTFLRGEVVVKLFGYSQRWRARFEGERTAYTVLATDPEIVAPRLLAAGQVFDDEAAAWPYLVTTRVRGVASWRAELSAEQWRSLAAQLGDQVRRVHALPQTGVPTHADLASVDVTTGANRSSLAPHLAERAAAYIAPSRAAGSGRRPRRPDPESRLRRGRPSRRDHRLGRHARGRSALRSFRA